MTSNGYNERDPGLLISRSLDDDLTAEEQRQLEARLDESAELAVEAAQVRKVSELVRKWAETEAKLDWEAHASLVTASLEPREKADSHLDGVLARWAAQSPAADDDRFVEGVLGRISGRRRLHARILRYGLPLAAAAVFVFMVTAVFWNAPPVSRPVSARSIVRIERPDGGFSMASVSIVRSEVSFARTVDVEPVGEEGIAMLSLGASASRGWTEASPL